MTTMIITTIKIIKHNNLYFYFLCQHEMKLLRQYFHGYSKIFPSAKYRAIIYLRMHIKEPSKNLRETTRSAIVKLW